ncbi:hypothetical protein AU468_02295 [Alkalispirochaeta sphaeroplastigenens]|uniref:NADH dehydrogenase n=1 Tax=Alkalispirochaeta sphaeroplastigenens TaxID=1187066 RepID=A0A2S4K0A8_9SPIO|nr:(2Fe-2S) ferredoxin domain-containing protein [Alkalispirochaeta sphaeroplastigenens]POR05197.1 hypothetical protein AU468_02295 [Alkalispirochaeta sphaeroplastigenens]
MNNITICLGSSCFARGNGAHLERIERWQEEQGLTGKIDLAGCRCRGECSTGPVLEINGQLHHGVDEGMLWDLLEYDLQGADRAGVAGGTGAADPAGGDHE